MLFGDKIRTVRLKSGLQQKQLADKIVEITGKPVKAGAVGHWENDKRPISIESLEAICKITNTPIGYFLSEDETVLKGKDLNNALIDKIIDDLIDEGVLTEEQSYADLDEHTQQILIGALNMHINKKLKNKDKK